MLVDELTQKAQGLGKVDEDFAEDAEPLDESESPAKEEEPEDEELLEKDFALLNSKEPSESKQ